MSRETTESWSHHICDECFAKKYPDKQPIRAKHQYLIVENCCFCGQPSKSGIYTREDPTKTRCNGTHTDSQKQWDCSNKKCGFTTKNINEAEKHRTSTGHNLQDPAKQDELHRPDGSEAEIA
jgi:hypothetical protein